MSEQLEEAFSIADFMDMDTSEVQGVVNEQNPPGKYTCEITNAEIKDHQNSDGDPRILVAFDATILEVHKVTKRGIEPESLVGKVFKLNRYLNNSSGQEQFMKDIASLKGYMEHGLGIPAENLGGTPQEYIGGAIGHRFEGTWIAAPNRNNPQRPYVQLEVKVRR